MTHAEPGLYYHLRHFPHFPPPICRTITLNYSGSQARPRDLKKSWETPHYFTPVFEMKGNLSKEKQKAFPYRRFQLIHVEGIIKLENHRFAASAVNMCLGRYQ